MKNRIRQRANRRIKEQMLDLRDICGLKDPTPYKAVEEIIRGIRYEHRKECSNLPLY